MRILKIIGIFSLLAIGSFTADAQQMITISQNAAMTQNLGSLNGKAGVVFLAKSNDMVITTSINKDSQSPKAIKAGNQYRYEFVIDISSSNARYFTVTKYGTTNSQKTGKIILAPNKQFFFDIEQVENGIDLKVDPNANMGWINGKKGEALIEFNSKIKLNIHCPNLKHTIRSGRSVAGTYLDSLIFDANQYAELAQKESQISEELENANKRMSKEVETMDDATYDALRDRIPQLAEELNKVSGKLSDILKIEVSGDKTNKMVIDYNEIKGMSPMSFLRYNIVVLNEVKEVFKTKYEELSHQALTHMKNRDYKTAQQYYEDAANQKDASDTDKETARNSAEKMARMAEFKDSADNHAAQVYELSRSNKMVDKKVLFNLMDMVAESYNALYHETGDYYYKEEADKMLNQKTKIGIVIKGKTVMSEYKGGILKEYPLTNVYVYGCQVTKNEMTEKEMEKRNYPNKGELITTITSIDGKFSFTIQPNQYKTLIFEAFNNKDIELNKAIKVEGRVDDRNIKVRLPKD